MMMKYSTPDKNYIKKIRIKWFGNIRGKQRAVHSKRNRPAHMLYVSTNWLSIEQLEPPCKFEMKQFQGNSRIHTPDSNIHTYEGLASDRVSYTGGQQQ